ncbi:MAG TPA: hypothetical protein VLD83_02275 [Candidatus Binatia bacterium]|nr:hypothetical protein [Candidatus Binatia bacterium]
MKLKRLFNNPKLLALLVVGITASGYGTVVLARGGGHPGAAASGHMSSKALSNTNGLFSSDRTKGLDRATERRSEQGRAHEQATDHDRTNKAGAKGKKERIATGSGKK